MNSTFTRVKEISSSNTIKSSDSHKNHIREQWRRKPASGQRELHYGIFSPTPALCLLFCFSCEIFQEVSLGEDLQTQRRLLLMWQEISFLAIFTRWLCLEGFMCEKRKEKCEQQVAVAISTSSSWQSQQNCCGSGEEEKCNLKFTNNRAALHLWRLMDDACLIALCLCSLDFVLC